MKFKCLLVLFLGSIFQSAFAQLDANVVCNQAGLNVTQAECQALVAVYNQNGGVNWIDGATWGAADVGTWGGVTVNANHVVELDRLTSGVALEGALSSELWSLIHLEVLRVGNTGIGVSLSSQIENLIQLEVLYLGLNGGSIPPEIGALNNLREIWWENAGLSGTIPVSLGNLTNLRKLRLSHNQLAGGIPSELENLTNLEEIYLDHNNLSGVIPSSLGNLPNLRFLYLSVNHLTGTLPDSFVGLGALDVLNVAENHLDADTNNNALIPASLTNWANSGVIILGQDQTVAGANNPPVISGSPSMVITVGDIYNFTPTASDPDVVDTLTFSISNQPSWTTFDSSTGSLSGTPSTTDIGVYSNIIISVTDGIDVVSLPVFSITVQAGGISPSTQVVPTLSFWALLILSLVMLVGSVGLFRKTNP